MIQLQPYVNKWQNDLSKQTATEVVPEKEDWKKASLSLQSLIVQFICRGRFFTVYVTWGSNLSYFLFKYHKVTATISIVPLNHSLSKLGQLKYGVFGWELKLKNT